LTRRHNRLAPLFVVSGASGSGKSWLIQLISEIAFFSVPPSVIMNPGDPYSSQMVAGVESPLVKIDNVNGEINLPLLLSMATENRITFRKIGAAKADSHEYRVLAINGINSSFHTSEYRRRVVRIDLEEHSTRTYDEAYDLSKNSTLAEELYQAACTLVDYYVFRLHRPEYYGNLNAQDEDLLDGKFAPWQNTVHGILNPFVGRIPVRGDDWTDCVCVPVGEDPDTWIKPRSTFKTTSRPAPIVDKRFDARFLECFDRDGSKAQDLMPLFDEIVSDGIVPPECFSQYRKVKKTSASNRGLATSFGRALATWAEETGLIAQRASGPTKIMKWFLCKL
jgi:hypothetical protein